MDNEIDRSVESYQNGSHVIAANAFPGFLGDEVVQKCFNGLFISSTFGFEQVLHLVDQSVRILNILFPNTITSHEDELVLLRPVEFQNIRVTGDHLIFVS